jgi:PAS domain S-box-containing protein
MSPNLEWQRSPEWAARRALVNSLWSIVWRSLAVITLAHLATTLLLSLFGHPLELSLYLLEIAVLLSIVLPATHLAILRPVTRLAAEQAAASAERRFRVIAEAIPDGIIIFGTDERIRYANSSAERLFGIRAGKLAEKNVRELVGPASRERYEAALQQIRSGGDLYEVIPKGAAEYAAQRADGSEFPAEVSASTLEDAGERVVVLVLRDITERKQAEEALRASERRYRELLDLLPVPVRIIQDGRICYANAADAQVFGLSAPQELTGADAYRFISPNDTERLREYYRRRMAGEDAPSVYRVTAVRKSGETFPCEIIARKIDFQQRPASLIVLRDLSVHQRLELFEQILPVCCVCGKIRDDSSTEHGKGEWGKLDDYVRRHSEAQFSHTFCPDCYAEYRRKEGLS